MEPALVLRVIYKYGNAPEWSPWCAFGIIVSFVRKKSVSGLEI